MHIEFLVEEPSMEMALNILVPKNHWLSTYVCYPSTSFQQFRDGLRKLIKHQEIKK